MNPVKDNPLRTREDFAAAAIALLRPLVPHMSEGRARIKLGDSGAVYTDEIAQMEAYSRPLWAIVPMLAGRVAAVEPYWALWREGLIHGVDPAHPEYWGEIGHFDQRMVEMAVMGMGMCIVPERFLGDLPEAAQRNLHRWLYQINGFEMPQNNWVFFRVLVNIGFQRNGLPFDADRLASDLALVEAHYEADGWYYDLPTQRDYYIPWAFHYYGQIYALAMRDRDPERAEAFISRAEAFLPQFAAWFAADGEALPYGRSLTYRFAQGSFFAAYALCGKGAGDLSWGQVKGLLLRNLRKWLSRPIFTGDGVLSIGYGYPNLHMAEGYNAPGSPYWAMKAFLALALPEEHPFWAAEEQTYAPADARMAELSPRMLLVRDAENAHVQGFTAGNHAPEHEYTDAKYEKFAYSTAFGFSTSLSARSLKQGAFDSMLALSDDGDAWRVRYGCEAFEIREDRVLCTWKPYADVTVTTEIIPLGDWHLRRHVIETARPLEAAEGGYAILRQRGDVQPLEQLADDYACAHAPWGTSGIRGLRGYDTAVMIVPDPNTNLLYPRTLLPTLRASIAPGRTELICAVLGAVRDGEAKWKSPPREEEAHASVD